MYSLSQSITTINQPIFWYGFVVRDWYGIVGKKNWGTLDLSIEEFDKIYREDWRVLKILDGEIWNRIEEKLYRQ
jgi:hypothetical protein